MNGSSANAPASSREALRSSRVRNGRTVDSIAICSYHHGPFAAKARIWRGLHHLGPLFGTLIVPRLKRRDESAAQSSSGERTLAHGREIAPGRTIRLMWGWIWIVALYLLGMSFYRWLGGLGAAADAIQRWGHATGERRRRTSSSGA